jgi:hypothetical protein
MSSDKIGWNEQDSQQALILGVASVATFLMREQMSLASFSAARIVMHFNMHFFRAQTFLWRPNSQQNKMFGYHEV